MLDINRVSCGVYPMTEEQYNNSILSKLAIKVDGEEKSVDAQAEETSYIRFFAYSNEETDNKPFLAVFTYNVKPDLLKSHGKEIDYRRERRSLDLLIDMVHVLNSNKHREFLFDIYALINKDMVINCGLDNGVIFSWNGLRPNVVVTSNQVKNTAQTITDVTYLSCLVAVSYMVTTKFNDAYMQIRQICNKYLSN